MLADKGYDSDANRAAIRRRGAEPCIPARKNRKGPIAYDRPLYRERNVIERFSGRVTQYRRVATRFDKKAENHLGFAWLAAINIMRAGAANVTKLQSAQPNSIRRGPASPVGR